MADNSQESLTFAQLEPYLGMSFNSLTCHKLISVG